MSIKFQKKSLHLWWFFISVNQGSCNDLLIKHKIKTLSENMAMTKALFLDRDGLINIDHGYVYKKEDFDFIDGIFDLCRTAKEKNFKVFVVTNQSGIGRGYFTENDFFNLSLWMCEKFWENGVVIEKVYFSPYHVDASVEKYKKEHFSRKPNPGMILDAEKEFDLDLKASLMLGDKLSDVQAGVSAGVGVNILYDVNGSVNRSSDFISVRSFKEIEKYF